MISLLFILTRELLEAILIISIMYAFMKNIGVLRQGRKFLGLGILGGIGLSYILALAIEHMSDWLEGAGMLYFEAVLFACSAGLMTHMVFWMTKAGRRLKSDLESKMQHSVTQGGLFDVAVISALAVGREGAEIVTYMQSLRMSQEINTAMMAATVAASLCGAILVFRGITTGVTKIKHFFQVTSVFLFLSAASLLVEATVRLTEAGILSPLVPVVWNTGHIIGPNSMLGEVLHILVGYTSSPSLMMVLVYLAYWTFVALTYYRPMYRPKTAVAS
ncbi:MAG: FTR1 family protein [Oligoflexales bacterium]